MQMPRDIGTFHIIGIGGIGMSAIAEILMAKGYTVQGSDQKDSANVRRLRNRGVRVFIGHDAINLVGARQVVISSAVKPGNPELEAARQKGLTIIRRAADLFWLITGSALGIRDRDWLDRGLALYAQAAGAGFRANDVQIRDITSAMGVLNLQGPHARQILASVCDEALDHEGFPFMTARGIRVGYAPVVAFRVTYVGELGWELFVPMEFMEHVYEMLMQAGRPLGLVNMGYHAIDSLRLEKRFLAWGADINSDYTPIEAGLDFLIDWNKGDFIGRSALARQRETGPARKLMALVLDENVPVFGGEAITRDGAAVAQATSGNFGYAIGKPIVLAYLPAAIAKAGMRLEVESFGRPCPATAVRGAPYDPKRSKVLI